MIISHKHKFIFIKTEKTAGTSIEIALSKYCGENDVITPIMLEDEEKRKFLGYREPQNYLIQFRKYSKLDWAKFIYRRKRLSFYHHASASFIRKLIDADIWDSYFKFCFDRNPWDKVISWYFWVNKKELRPTISEFVQSKKANTIRGFDLYAINGQVVVDRVYHFEELNWALEEITEIVGLPEVPQLPHAKGGHRIDKRSYRDILSTRDREKIAKVYAREIAYCGYEW